MRFIDSHTEGEPTRVLLSDAYRSRTLEEVLAPWRDETGICTPPEELRALTANPRAPEACVGALLCKPSTPDADCAVFFFNKNAALGMCGHGAIGVAGTLEHLCELHRGSVRLETRAGIVEVRREVDGAFSFENVPSCVVMLGLELELPDCVVHGDVAYGGNEFFIVEEARAMRSTEEELAYTRSIRDALARQEVCGLHGPIDHVALFLQPSRSDANERSFVLCPNDTFDRSPCGTGSAARLAVLAAKRRLRELAPHIIESAIGSRFLMSFEHANDNAIIASIQGRAWITAEGTLETQHDPARSDGWREET